MEKKRSYIHCVFTVACAILIAFPVPVFANDDGEIISPAAHRRESIFKAVQSLWTDDDPTLIYLLLLPFAFERIISLRHLFTQVPNAITSLGNLRHYGDFRVKYLKYSELYTQIKAEEPELTQRLETEIMKHGLLVNRLKSQIFKLRDASKNGFNDKVGGLNEALDAWEKETEIALLDRWIDHNSLTTLDGLQDKEKDFIRKLGESLLPRGDRNRKPWGNKKNAKAPYLYQLGREWFESYQDFKERETQSAIELVARANQLTDLMNKRLPLDERFNSFDFEDSNKTRSPNRIYMPNPNGSGFIRVAGKQVSKDMGERCELAFDKLASKVKEMGSKGSRMSLVTNAGAMALPVLTLGSALAVVGFTVSAYMRSARKWGDDPEAARARQQYDRQREKEIHLRPETSFAGELSRRGDELKPFTDAIIAQLKERGPDLLKKAQSIAQSSPHIAFDAKDAEAILTSKKYLQDQINEALPFAIQETLAANSEMNFGQFKAFLVLAPHSPTGRKTTHQLLDKLYSRILTNIFPEFNENLEGEFGPVSVNAGHRVGSGGIKSGLIRDTLESIKNINLEQDSDIAPHPAISGKRPSSGAHSTKEHKEPEPDVSSTTPVNQQVPPTNFDADAGMAAS